jgi:protein involved in polysaccharide export with SLBB domain
MAMPAAVTVLAPEPPSEFQRFVATSVGQVLPIFGAELFQRVPTTFAPLDRVPVTADYVIGPGDEILLRVWGQVNMDQKLPVDRAGAVYIPQVGNVTVSGLEFRQLPEFLRSQLGRVFRNFDLSVNMGQLRSIQVFVVGQARQPGTYTVSSFSTLATVLFASGGPSAKGSMRRIQLKRGSKVVTELDMYDLLLRGDKTEDARLLPQDVVYIPPVGSQVAAAGSVKNPAIYELKDEKTVGEVVQMAGGLSPVADRKRATIERIKDGVAREVLDISLGPDGMNTTVTDGDVLQVLAIIPRFENTVTLRGNVANPGRFRWHPGMRLREMIPDKESLVTRDYWKNRNLLGNAPIDDRSGDGSEKALPGGYRSGNEGEIIAKMPTGETAGSTPVAEALRKTKGTRIEITAPDINWSYAVIERLNSQTLLTNLFPFNLGKLILENDESQNLELQSGDVVTIFSQADIRVPQMEQRRMVFLEGEFKAPGVYRVRPGETLGNVIERAGGLTPQAYLYGAEFLRETVRQDQQKRLDKYLMDLEREIEQTASARMGNVASASDTAALNAQLQTERQMVQKLRSVQATGRIVLGLKPESSDLSSIAGMTLEDQDRFVIPSRLSTVNVLGAVYTPNAFLYQENSPASEYMRQAGGPTRQADKDRAYVVRADGSVLSRQDPRFGMWGEDFTEMRLYPGDSIMIPEKVLKTPFMTSLRDWTQIIFQIGMTAATIVALNP